MLLKWPILFAWYLNGIVVERAMRLLITQAAGGVFETIDTRVLLLCSICNTGERTMVCLLRTDCVGADRRL